MRLYALLKATHPLAGEDVVGFELGAKLGVLDLRLADMWGGPELGLQRGQSQRCVMRVHSRRVCDTHI
jgi:hypothetical protein